MTAPTDRPGSYLPLPQFHRLNYACGPVRRAFDCPPYLVGSVLHRADFRDVDLRLPMSTARGGTDFTAEGPRLLLINCAISEWLARGTGLPIDFQLQSEDEWASHDGDLRNPLGLTL